MKKFLISILMTLLFLGCSKTPEEQISDLYDAGLQQVKEFDFAKADSTFKRIYDVKETSPYGLLGEALINESRLEYFDAINNYLLILSLTSSFDEAHVGLYRSFRNSGYFHDAFDAAVFYNSLRLDDPEALYLLAEAYFNLGEQSRAKHYCLQAIEKGFEDTQAAQFMIARSFLKEGNYDSAKTYVHLATTSSSNSTEYYNQAAAYYEAAGLIDSAVTYSKKYYATDSKSINVSFIHFQRLLRNKYFFEARQVITNLESFSVEPQVLEGFKMFYALHTDDKSAIRLHGQQYGAYTPNSLTAMVYDMYTRGEISDKITLMQNVQLINSNVARGMYSDEFGKFYKYVFTMLFSQYEKGPMSMDFLNEIEDVRRNRREIRIDIAVTNHIIGLFKECFSILEILEKSHKTQADWLTDIAGVYGHYAVRKYNEAERVFSNALDVNKQYLPAFLDYLEMLERIEQYDQALKLFNRYSHFETDNPKIALEKSKYYFLAGQYDKGVEQFRKFFENSRGDLVFVREVLGVLEKNKRDKEIASIIKIVEEFSSDKPEALIMLAEYNQDQNNFQVSLDKINAALAIEPINPDANIMRARVLYDNGQKTEAYDLFEENLTRFSKNAKNLLYYSSILAEEEIDFDKAANLARQAVFEGYAKYEYVMNLSDIYYKMGRYNLSRGEAMKVRLHTDNHPYPFYRIGMTYYQEGNPDNNDKMKENFNTAIKYGLSGEYLKEVQEILKNI